MRKSCGEAYCSRWGHGWRCVLCSGHIQRSCCRTCCRRSNEVDTSGVSGIWRPQRTREREYSIRIGTVSATYLRFGFGTPCKIHRQCNTLTPQQPLIKLHPELLRGYRVARRCIGMLAILVLGLALLGPVANADAGIVRVTA
jgi:hypothetical protein